MTRGLTRQQIGITDAMIEAFGDLVFELSTNVQVRRGDPIRELDFEEIERQRAKLGLSDAEIASRVGLSRDQVTYIRNFVERRRLRSDTYHRLNELGGGRRFRAERHTDVRDRPHYSEAAMRLRDAMTYDPAISRRYVEAGYWNNDTLRSWLDRWAAEAADRPAIEVDGTVITYGDLMGRVRRLASAFNDAGIGKGDVVAVQRPNITE